MSNAAAKEDNLKSVKDLIAERPDIDTTEVFGNLRGIQDKLWAKIENRFPDLQIDQSTVPLQPYHSLDKTAHGNLKGFTSEEVDWGVCSYVENASQSFCNLHITMWMKSHTYLPHLAMACGTFPVFFFLLDYIPRKHTTVHPEYLDKYLAPSNEQFLKLNDDKRFKPFISQSTYVREAISAGGFTFIAQPETKGTVETFEEAAVEFFDRWIGWSKEEDPVPEEKREALAAQDLAIRRNTAELDPANIVVENLYGKKLTDKLVRGLWGGDRSS